MDITTLSLAKKYANKVAAGFSKVEVQGNNLIFTLNDGTKATMTIPTPEKGSDGISIVDVSIDIDGSLLCHMSDGSTINAGKITEYDLHSQELDNKIVSTRNELERVKNDVLETGTDTDTYIHLEDSAMAEYQELSVDGVCEQKTTSGSNLCNLNVVQDSRVIYNSDGTITINGEGGFTLKFSDYTFKANTTYYMKWELVSGSVNQEQIFLVLDGKFFVIKDIFAPFKFDSDTVKKGFWIHDNALFTDAIIKIWFSETQTDFESYTGGQPSPSPDYPQPISVIENSLKITSCNKNLLKLTTFTDGTKTQTKNGVTATINDDGTITCKGTATKKTTFYLQKNYLGFTLGDGCFLCNSPSANQRVEFICSIDGIEKYLSSYGTCNFINAKTSFEFRQVLIIIAKDENVDITFTPMFAKGTIVASYEQHLETQIQANLPEGEFIGKINDTYKDTLKVEYNETDGQYHLNLYKKLSKKVFDGSGNWYQSSKQLPNTFTTYTFLNDMVDNYVSTDLLFMSDKFKGVSNSGNYTSNDSNIITQNSSNQFKIMIIRIEKSLLSSVDVEGFKTWLSTNKPLVYYPLKTPYVVDLGVVDMPITYNETTNLFTDSDLLPTINAKYYRNFISTVRNLQVNEKALKQELIDINARLSALETAQTSAASESEVVE